VGHFIETKGNLQQTKYSLKCTEMQHMHVKAN